MEEFTKALEYFPDMDEGTKDAPLDNVFYFKRYHYKSAEPTVYRTGLCILLPPNASTKHKHKTLPLMGATRLASG